MSSSDNTSLSSVKGHNGGSMDHQRTIGAGLDRIETSIGRDVKRYQNDSDACKNLTLWGKMSTTLYDLLWPGVILSHLDLASLKIIARSWAMMWSLSLLCIIGGGPAEFMGPSSFLADFSCGIAIDGNLSVSAAFLYCLSYVVSVVFAFLISVVTMGINWRIRGYPTESEVISELVAAGHCTNVSGTLDFSNCILPEMHNGAFLNVRTTVVTIFGMLFSFTLCGCYQSWTVYGKLGWLLNSLFTIIVFPFNNLMPVWRPWYFARNVCIPMFMSCSVSFVAALVIFPFSSHYKIATSLSKACIALKDTAEKIEALNLECKPSSEDFSVKFGFIKSDTQAILTKYIQNPVDMGVVNRFEIWFSRYDANDLEDLTSHLRIVMSALSSFQFFYESVADHQFETVSGPDSTSNSLSHEPKTDRVRSKSYLPKYFQDALGKTWKDTGAYEHRQKQSFRARASGQRNSPFSENVLEAEFDQIVSLYRPVVLSTSALLGEISAFLHKSASIFHQSPVDQISQSLRSALEEQTRRLDEVSSSHLSNEEFALHAYTCTHFARRVRRLGKRCLAMHRNRPRPKLVYPFLGCKGRYMTFSTSPDEDEFEIAGHDLEGEPYVDFKPLHQVQSRNPDSTPPRSVLHLFGLIILKVRRIFYDQEFLFSLKRAVITVATLTPYFCRPTVHLAFRHWFLWVAVLTTYTIGQQAVDGIYGLVAKFVFNFFGCLVGMVGWYISTGSGRGNPYGYAVVTAFVWLYIAFLRQFNTHFTPSTSIVFSCTVTLVLGESWSDGHISLEGVALGKGFSVAWIRFVTVSIGITVSFLGTIFPHAYTAKKAVRVIIGSCIERLGDLHSSVSNFGVQRYMNHNVRIVAHRDIITKEARAIITSLNSAETLRKRLVYEPPLSGHYPTNKYKLLINYVRDTAELYSLVYTLFDEVKDTKRIPDLLRAMGWTNPSLSTGSYSLIYMASRALADGKALPSVTAGHLAEMYHFQVMNSPDGKVNSEDSTVLTAMTLNMQIYKRIDGFVMLTKELVGEVYDVNMSLFDLDESGKRP